MKQILISKIIYCIEDNKKYSFFEPNYGFLSNKILTAFLNVNYLPDSNNLLCVNKKSFKKLLTSFSNLIEIVNNYNAIKTTDTRINKKVLKKIFLRNYTQNEEKVDSLVCDLLKTDDINHFNSLIDNFDFNNLCKGNFFNKDLFIKLVFKHKKNNKLLKFLKSSCFFYLKIISQCNDLNNHILSKIYYDLTLLFDEISKIDSIKYVNYYINLINLYANKIDSILNLKEENPLLSFNRFYIFYENIENSNTFFNDISIITIVDTKTNKYNCVQVENLKEKMADNLFYNFYKSGFENKASKIYLDIHDKEIDSSLTLEKIIGGLYE